MNFQIIYRYLIVQIIIVQIYLYREDCIIFHNFYKKTSKMIIYYTLRAALIYVSFF